MFDRAWVMLRTQSHLGQEPRVCLRFLFFFFPLFLFHGSVFTETASFHELSPIYEEMVGNQVDQLRRELVQAGVVDKRAAFWVAGWDEASGVIASEVVQSLSKKKFKFKTWRYANALPTGDFHGVVLFLLSASWTAEELEVEVDAACQFMSEKQHVGFLIVLVPDGVTRTSLEMLIQHSGCSVRSAIPERELEFVKDATGKQLVHLDLDRFRLKIYERLVREGINPVDAMPASDEAIRRFRSSQNRTILVVERS